MQISVSPMPTSSWGVKPEKTLTDYLEGKAQLPDCIADGQNGLKLISGGQGMAEMANLDEHGRKRIVDAIMDLRSYCDLILVDTGAGVSSAVTDFVQMADHTLVVTNANFAAIANAYGIIKVMVSNGYDKPMHLVVNRARSTEEAKQVFMKLKGCTKKFLDSDLGFLGLVPEDIQVQNSVQKRTPFSEAAPDSIASTYLRKLVDQAEGLIGNRVGSEVGE